MERTFTNVDDQVLIRLIEAVQQKIVFVAPGISKSVAERLAYRLVNDPQVEITVILDIDAEVCRLGYGDIEGLSAIKMACEKRGSLLLHQPGIRIGLLIADGTTLIYSPTPLLIEAGSTQPNKPNAICLDSIVAQRVEAACNSNAEQPYHEVGLDPAKAPTIQSLLADLKSNPPQKFDVSRVVRVFNSVIQYVEFEFKGYKLSMREVVIPPDLMGLADDPMMAERWHNTFRPFQQSEAFRLQYKYAQADGQEREEWVTERTLEKERFALKRRYLRDIPGYGTVIRRREVDEFEAQVKLLGDKVECFSKSVMETIKDAIKSSAKNLKADLWVRVKDRQLAILGWNGADEAEREQMLVERISEILQGAVDAYAPKISKRYKEVSPVSIRDPGFQAAIVDAYGEEGTRFFHEFDAASGTD